MLVTEIIAYSKSKYKIMIDYEFAFVLYKGELRLYHLQEGAELAETDYWKIMREVLPKRARLRCMNLLKSRRYTEKQLLDKLQQGGYPSEIAQEALSYVKSYGYVDDEQYARDYINSQMSVRSKTRIRNDLLKKGIGFEIIDIIWEEEAAESSEQMEQEQILLWLEKKNYNPDTADCQEKRKISAFLYRKGFQSEIISQVLRQDKNHI